MSSPTSPYSRPSGKPPTPSPSPSPPTPPPLFLQLGPRQRSVRPPVEEVGQDLPTPVMGVWRRRTRVPPCRSGHFSVHVGGSKDPVRSETETTHLPRDPILSRRSDVGAGRRIFGVLEPVTRIEDTGSQYYKGRTLTIVLILTQ